MRKLKERFYRLNTGTILKSKCECAVPLNLSLSTLGSNRQNKCWSGVRTHKTLNSNLLYFSSFIIFFVCNVIHFSLACLNVVDPDPYWILIGSVFRSFVDPDPYSEYGSGSTRVNKEKKMQKVQDLRNKFTIQRLN